MSGPAPQSSSDGSPGLAQRVVAKKGDTPSRPSRRSPARSKAQKPLSSNDTTLPNDKELLDLIESIKNVVSKKAAEQAADNGEKKTAVGEKNKHLEKATALREKRRLKRRRKQARKRDLLLASDAGLTAIEGAVSHKAEEPQATVTTATSPDSTAVSASPSSHAAKKDKDAAHADESVQDDTSAGGESVKRKASGFRAGTPVVKTKTARTRVPASVAKAKATQQKPLMTLINNGIKSSNTTRPSKRVKASDTQGFGLADAQQHAKSKPEPASKILEELRKRFFLPSKGEPPNVSLVKETIKELGARFSFADLKRVYSDHATVVEKSEQQTASQKSQSKTSNFSPPTTTNIDAKALVIEPLDIEQPAVAKLSFGLDRVLFNPGVTLLQDPHSRVYNFDPYLQHIMPVKEFDFNALKKYQTSSEDTRLSELAQAHGKKYVGSTSSMTAALAHFHYLLSHFRDINAGMLSRNFHPDFLTFTRINRAPSSIFLRWKNGTYAIDADKEWDTPNVLMMLGKSMEKLLTMSKDEFERYRKSDPREITEDERNEPEAFQYTTMGDMLMRSQLDAYDERLPGNGTFDLKTRAVVSIRMNSRNFESMLGYELLTLHGEFESYEREYFDMMRSTMLKYMLQARMGRMDGIFMAYHNIERLFGFQYLPMHEIDRAMHGQIDPSLGDQEFKVSLRIMNDVLNAATAKFPEQSLRIMFETEGAVDSELAVMRIFAEPVSDEGIDKLQSTAKERIAAYEEKMMGIVREELAEEPAEKPAEEGEEVKQDPKQSETSAASKDNNSSSSTEAPAIDAAPKESTNLKNFERPLYSALVLVESSVNDKLVVRPTNLTPEDNWTVKYSFVEFGESRLKEAWAFYEQAKARRKTAFAVEDDTEDSDNSWYNNKLRTLAAKGRKFRAATDEAEAGKEPVVWS